MHEVLFPIGKRQRAALVQLDSGADPRVCLAALHKGFALGVLDVATAVSASNDILEWLLLADEPLAASVVSELEGPAGVTACARQRVIDGLESGAQVGDVYSQVAVPDLRHRLGEYYTPSVVVERVVSGLRSEADVIADPACGDGRFLTALIRRGHDSALIWGGDLNPVAVIMARWEVWKALGQPRRVPATPIGWTDFLVGDSGATFSGWPGPRPPGAPAATDFVGNPPWVLWRNLSDRYRAMVATVFGETSLNQTKGWAARVSAGQTDLSYLFLHEAIERVAPNGAVSFVMPKTLLKSPVGAAVVRSGRTTSGRQYAYKSVWDFAGTEVFAEVRTDTLVVTVQADSAQEFPVPWERIADPRCAAEVQLAYPSDSENLLSAWWTGESGDTPLRLRPGLVRASLVARGGVNTGGGNGIFHVDVVAGGNTGSVLIRNSPSSRFPCEVVEHDVEEHLVHPLLKGKGIRPWAVKRNGWIVLPHDPSDLRKPLREAKLVESAPQAASYLKRFMPLLQSRKELARWGGEYYSLFRIGPYTLGRWRVVWPCSAGQKMRAAVLADEDRTVPDQSVVMVAFTDPDPALFLCALLNCTRVRNAVASGGGLDSSPNLMKRLALPAWDSQNDDIRAVMGFSRRAYENCEADQDELDSLVKRLYG